MLSENVLNLKGIEMRKGIMSLEEAQEPLVIELPKAWVAFDLDGTLAMTHPDGWQGVEHIGAPIAPMIKRIQSYIKAGKQVKIYTARVALVSETVELSYIEKIIGQWCLEHIGQILPITNVKDMFMEYCYDDRCRQVVENTGIVVGEVLNN